MCEKAANPKTERPFLSINGLADRTQQLTVLMSDADGYDPIDAAPAPPVDDGLPPKPEMPQELITALAEIGKKQTLTEWETKLEALNSALEEEDLPETDLEALLSLASRMNHRFGEEPVEWSDLVSLLRIVEGEVDPSFGVRPSREAHERQIWRLERKIASYDGPDDEEANDLIATAARLSEEYEEAKTRHAEHVRSILRERLGNWSAIPQDLLPKIKNSLLFHRAMCMFDLNYFKHWFPNTDPPPVDEKSLARLAKEQWQHLSQQQRLPIREEFDRFKASYKALGKQ